MKKKPKTKNKQIEKKQKKNHTI